MTTITGDAPPLPMTERECLYSPTEISAAKLAESVGEGLLAIAAALDKLTNTIKDVITCKPEDDSSSTPQSQPPSQLTLCNLLGIKPENWILEMIRLLQNHKKPSSAPSAEHSQSTNSSTEPSTPSPAQDAHMSDG